MSSPKRIETAVAELTLAFGSLIRRIRAAAPSKLSELSWTQKSVIARLDKDGPATAADLARAEGIKSQSMGAAIATLEKMGLVERKAHPTDGRRMSIVLTAKGKAMRKDTREAKHTWLAQAIEKLGQKEQEKLFAAGEVIKKLADL
ncbi:MAG: MarR family transcriptional regulator [Verrucomicrobiae bacterium]|nr:MarR family transcriptional regulator [Verrucomicrobiae bacterium]